MTGAGILFSMSFSSVATQLVIGCAKEEPSRPPSISSCSGIQDAMSIGTCCLGIGAVISKQAPLFSHVQQGHYKICVGCSAIAALFFQYL